MLVVLVMLMAMSVLTGGAVQVVWVGFRFICCSHWTESVSLPLGCTLRMGRLGQIGRCPPWPGKVGADQLGKLWCMGTICSWQWSNEWHPSFLFVTSMLHSTTTDDSGSACVNTKGYTAWEPRRRRTSSRYGSGLQLRNLQTLGLSLG